MKGTKSKAYEWRKSHEGNEKNVAHGDLIFTSKGIAGPLALNLSRELVPVISQYGEWVGK